MKRRSLIVGKPKLSPSSLQVSDRRGPSGGGGGLLAEDVTGGGSPTSITVGYLLLEDGSFLLQE